MSYNRAFRVMHCLPSHCSASGMFVTNNVKSFGEGVYFLSANVQKHKHFGKNRREVLTRAIEPHVPVEAIPLLMRILIHCIILFLPCIIISYVYVL